VRSLLVSRFEFSSPGRIVFGHGSVAEVGAAALELASERGGGADLGRKPRLLLVSGGNEDRLAPLVASLDASGIERISFEIRREPRFEDARSALKLARLSDCDIVLGFGGGSALDLAKAVAVLLANPGDPLDYAEVIGGGKALDHPSFPCIAVPTTAGTGSEATRNAVLASSEKGVKVSLRSSSMLPRLALIDPELAYGLPPRVTAETGMDALTQLIEPLVCSSPNPLVDALCREALPLVASALLRAYRDGADAEARADMAYASLSGGLALANAKLGAVHGIAGPLGGAFPIPHGAACAALLAPTCEANVAALRSRSPESPVLARYAELAALIGGSPSMRPEDLAPALRELSSRLEIRPLRSFGIPESAFSGLAAKAAASSSMKGNPIALLPEEIEAILEKAT
jgi:alcohol dehydrogenase class IV